jgi:hypothetical protein
MNMQVKRLLSRLTKTTPSPTSIHKLHCPPSPKATVIFLHGLDGDACKTWGFDKQPSWKTWLLEGVPDLQILSVGYRVTWSGWRAISMPIQDRAVNIIASLEGSLVSPR